MSHKLQYFLLFQVSTIFCCNSSNSTMNQPVTQAVPISQIDNYSIYSYKQGAIPADTLLSTGTLGDASLRTETLRSTASHASPQPQYRVSDINPDFARRFNETNNQHYWSVLTKAEINNLEPEIWGLKTLGKTMTWCNLKQYRVSEINPDFVRRFNITNNQH